MKKKIIPVLSLLGIAGALALGAGLTSGSKALGVKADGNPVEYISVSDMHFTNIGTDTSDAGFNGFISSSTRTYWDEHYSHFALDDFISTGFSTNEQVGYDNEGWTGTLRSNSWKQFTPYVYFQLGGALNDGDGVRLEFHAGTYTWTILNDTFSDGRMILRYFEIPSEDFADLEDEENGFDMYVNIVDGRTNNWGLLNFGYFHPNQTKESVGDAMRFYLNHMSQADIDAAGRKTMQGHYYGNAYLRNVFYSTAADISDGFDSQRDFTKHWYFDHTYLTGKGAGVERHFDAAISDRANHSNGTPYNKEGAGFFRGYHEGDNNTGFMATDESRYRFISRPFVVDEDNPFISIKMGGRASLHVINATTDPGTDQAADLAWIDNTFYNVDTSHGEIDPLIYSGWNVTTMVRHIINLQAYAGSTIQLAIADVDFGTFWKAANFDELHVNFTPTSFGVDALTQVNNDETYHCAFADKYISSEHDDSCAYGIKYKNSENAVTDTTDVRAAAYFLEDYYLLARDLDNGTDVCANNVFVSAEMKTLLGNSGYNGLTDGAKHIVCASTDYQQKGSAPEWYHNAVSTFTVGSSIEYLLARNNISGVTYSNLVNSGIFGDNGMWGCIAVTMIAGVAGILAFFFIKKRKHEAK